MKLKKLPQTLLTVGLLSSMAFSVYAQEAEKTVKEEVIQKIEVIGSNIKRTNIEGPSPIQTISAAEILSSGATNMQELMQMLPSITSGGQDDITSGNGFAAGTSTASMRGLGSASTLVLINGRRMAATAAADPNAGQSSLFNLNSIPLSAIERVDVLLDAASAVYGSDAMAGVINYVLKKEYKGLQASARTAFADQGDFASQGVSVFGGFGDFDDQGYNVMIGLDLSNRPSTPYTRLKGIDQYQLNNTLLLNTTTLAPGYITDPDSSITFTPNYWPETKAGSNSYNTTVPLAPTLCPAEQVSSTYLTSKAPVCTVDLSQWSKFVSQQKSANFFSRANFKISSNLSASVEFAADRIESNYNAGFATLSNGTSSWFDPSGKLRTFRHTMAANHPDNPLFQANSANQLRLLTSARLADVPTGTGVVNGSTRLVGELSGTHYGWDWTAGILFNKSNRDVTTRGRINSLTAQAALDKYRFGGVNSPELLAQISPDSYQKGESEVNIIDFKGSREIGKLSGGPIGFAAGAEIRQEKINVYSDPLLSNGDLVGVGSTSVKGSREVGGIFSEVNLPLLKSLEVSAAVRYDHFSDYGSNTTPQVKVKWAAMDKLSVRASYAQGYRAPSLSQISNSSVSSFQTFSGYRDAVRCPLINGVPSRIPGATNYTNTNECNSGTTYSRSVSSYIVADPNLRPETSVNKGFGFVFAPTSSFGGTLDFYEILRENEVDRLSSSDIIQKFYEFGETAYANDFFRATDEAQMLKTAAGVVIPGTGAIAGVKRRYGNFGSTRVRGIDLDLKYSVNLGTMGKITTNLNMGFIKENRFQRNKGGVYTFYTDDGATPNQKGNLNVRWNKGAWSTSTTVNYVSDYGLPRTNSSTGERIECSPTITAVPAYGAAVGGDCRVSSWTTFDFNTSYSGFKNIRLSATIRNIFAREAPVDPFYRAAPYYNTDLHNIRGRNFSLNARYTFN